MWAPSTAKVLITEPDPALLQDLTHHLSDQGLQVLGTREGSNALGLARRLRPNLVLVDDILPDSEPATLCRTLRREVDARIVLLANRGQGIEAIVALYDETDDFIFKPLDWNELTARLDLVLQRAQRDLKTLLASGDLLLDVSAHRAWRNGETLNLPRKEFYLLAELMRHRGIALSRQHLLERVWKSGFSGDSRTLDVHIRALREKIELDVAQPSRIETVRGLGYRFSG